MFQMVWSDDESVLPKLNPVMEYCESCTERSITDVLKQVNSVFTAVSWELRARYALVSCWRKVCFRVRSQRWTFFPKLKLGPNIEVEIFYLPAQYLTTYHIIYTYLYLQQQIATPSVSENYQSWKIPLSALFLDLDYLALHSIVVCLGYRRSVCRWRGWLLGRRGWSGRGRRRLLLHGRGLWCCQWYGYQG